jgi:DNA replication protein DnaC
MRKDGSADKPEPEPKICEFCQKEMRYLPLHHPIDKYRIAHWMSPGICGCAGSLEEELRIEAEKAEQKRIEAEKELNRKIKDAIGKSGIPPRYQRCTFDNYKITESNKQAYDVCVKYLESTRANCQEGKGLILLGPVGTGKTFLASAIGMGIIRELGWVAFGTTIDLLSSIKATYEDDKGDSEQQVIRRLNRVDFLIIDDFGKEKVKPWVEQTIYQIINYRYQHLKPVIITTNAKSMKEIRNAYPNAGEAIESRLSEMCQGVFVGGDDYRKR